MTDGIDLDRPETYARLDPDDMYRRITELPQQIEDSWRGSAGLSLPAWYRNVQNVLVAGMGGSAIGGSLLQAYGADTIPLPIAVWRDYGLPAWAGENTLIIAVSYSGNTEETVSALTEAKRRGAKLIAVSTGGTVTEMARHEDIPLLSFSYAAQPRATIGYLFTPLLRIFSTLGLLEDQERDVREAIDVATRSVERWGGDMPASENAAKRIAEASHGREVVIYGAEFLDAVAHRWKTQMNENAKNWSFWEEFPELDHNAVVGYEYPKALSDAVQVVTLYSGDLSPRIRLRMSITQKILEGFGGHWMLAEADGNGRLAQMYSLIALGDFASYYLALLNGADPTSIAPINFLKQELAQDERNQGVPPVSATDLKGM